MRTVAAPRTPAGARLSNGAADDWKRIKNGELLALGEEQFDPLLTSNQNLPYQQNLTGRTMSILELSTNKLRA